jgi:hypothetical protein
MRKEDTPSFLLDFLTVRSAPLLESFGDWASAKIPIIRGFGPCVDHFSYKCREVREYDALRSRFEEYAEGWQGCRFLHQTVISGRRVAVIGLEGVIPTALGDLRVLELSEPKPMSADAGGFDHVEIFPKRGTIAEMAEALNRNGHALAPFVLKARPHHATWDVLLPADGRPGRQDLIIRLTDGPLVEKIGIEMR